MDKAIDKQDSASKMLIIEDDMNISSALVAQFSVAGFKTTAFIDSDILHIIRRIRLYKPDDIILDLALPALDGHKLLAAIRAEEGIGRTPIFVFTDISDEDLKNQSLKLGADHFFSREKLNIDEFVQKVVKIISNKKKISKINKVHEIQT